jgi:hypothetical protein
MEARVVAGDREVAEFGETPLQVLDQGHRGIPVGAEGGRIRGAPSCAIETGGEEGGVVGHGSRYGSWGSEAQDSSVRWCTRASPD